MGIFSGNTGSNNLMLVFDIGSSSVGGALFRVGENGVPNVVRAFREPIMLQETLEAEEFLSSTLKALEIVAEKIYKSAVGAPKMVFCVLSSPWHISQTRVIHLEKNTPFTFTAKLADTLIRKEIALFEESISKSVGDKNAVKSIEFKNIKIELNGYESPNPLNQKAQELEMTVFLSLAGAQVIAKIEETVRKYFHPKAIRFCSFKLASFAVIRDFFVHNQDFLLLDVDGEVTDISMTKKNLLRESISFPLGTNFIIRKAAALLGAPFNMTKSLLSLFEDGHVADTEVKNLAPVVEKLKKEWLTKFQESLANISNDISVPSDIYMTVDKDKAPFFINSIENEQFNQYTLTQSKFKIIFLGPEFFHGMAQFDEGAIRDPRLIIDSVYVSRFLVDRSQPTV